MSQGGASKAHPCQTLPQRLSLTRNEGSASIEKVRLKGCFALYVKAAEEEPGTEGFAIELRSEQETTVHILRNGIHYADSLDLEAELPSQGDGIVVERIGQIMFGDTMYRIDEVAIELKSPAKVKEIVIRDLGTPASAIVLGVSVDEVIEGCPFHSKHGGVSLSDIPAIIRAGDKLRFQSAVAQMELGLKRTTDLDEARGEALTFLAVLTASTLELGGSRALHRLQLDAARKFDQLQSADQIAAEALKFVKMIIGPVFAEGAGPSAKVVEQALGYVDRNFARDISDADVAKQLGLSTSHFRFLFKEVTHQPFHKFLVAKRLEQAKLLLVDHGYGVAEAASSVGFSNVSHFSRAFTQRFKVSPNQIKKASL